MDTSFKKQADASQSFSDQKKSDLFNALPLLDVVGVCEKAAIAATCWRGRGDETAADQAAVDAMRCALNRLPIQGRIVIGEGERDEAPMLYIGEKVGMGIEPRVDIALDPLEGTTICAKNGQNSLAVMAFSEEGGLLNAPDSYMEKIAVGAGYPEGIVDLDASVRENIEAIARVRGISPKGVRVCVLDRPRHATMIQDIRSTGASIRLIGDGDVAGVIQTTKDDETGVDLYMGTGGAPEGVLAAAALKCVGGQMQGRLVGLCPDQEVRAREMGISNLSRKYTRDEMVSGSVLFIATGVTNGDFLKGVYVSKNLTRTHSVLMRSHPRTLQWITTEHLSGV